MEIENSTVLQRSSEISPFVLNSFYNFLLEYLIKYFCLFFIMLLKFFTVYKNKLIKVQF